MINETLQMAFKSLEEVDAQIRAQNKPLKESKEVKPMVKGKTLKESYEDLDADWENFENDIIEEVKKKFPEFNGPVFFDDSRAWSLYINGRDVGLKCDKFGAYRNYNGGGVRGPIQHNGRPEDDTVELGEFFAKKLEEVEDVINSGHEGEEWDKPTGVLAKESKADVCPKCGKKPCECEKEDKKDLKEGKTFDLDDTKEREEVKSFTKELEDKEEVEQIVDVEASSIDELEDNYRGCVILQCPVCKTKIYKRPEDVTKVETEDLEDDEEVTFNGGEECPHCGSKDGYTVIGQVASLSVKLDDKGETPKEDEPIEEPKEKEPKEEEEAPIEAPNVGDIKDEEKPEEEEDEIKEESLKHERTIDVVLEDFSENRFDKLVNKYVHETYEDVDSYTTTNANIDDIGRTIVMEGKLNFKSGKEWNTKFVFEAKAMTKTGKIRFVGINESFTNEKKAFSLLGTVVGNRLMCESLSYKYKSDDKVVSGRVVNRPVKK